MPKPTGKSDRSTDSEQDTSSQLPTCDGTQLDLGIWLRNLLNSQHLLPPEIAYFVITGALATKDHKTVVCSLQHGILLKSGYIHRQGFSVTEPPPIEDGFVALYAQARADGEAVPINPTATDLGDGYPISTDRIKALDMKFMNDLLSLITSSGRRLDYGRKANHSGIALMRLFVAEKDAGTTPYAQSPHVRGIKLLLANALKRRMSLKSQRQFDEIKDQIEELNTQLPDNEQLTSPQRADHYRRLIYKLKSESLRGALATDLTVNKVPHDDALANATAITRVLTSQLVDEQFDELDEAEPGNAFQALDPRKTGLDKSKPPDTACRFCGKFHWMRKCFQNPNADEATKKIAPKSSPAGIAWAKHLSDKASAGKKSDKADTAKKAEKGGEDKQDMEGLIARAMEDSEASTILLGDAEADGSARLAFADDSEDPSEADSDEFPLLQPPAAALPIAMPRVGIPLGAPIAKTTPAPHYSPDITCTQRSDVRVDSSPGSSPSFTQTNRIGLSARLRRLPERIATAQQPQRAAPEISTGFSLRSLVLTGLLTATLAFGAATVAANPPTVTWPSLPTVTWPPSAPLALPHVQTPLNLLSPPLSFLCSRAPHFAKCAASLACLMLISMLATFLLHPTVTAVRSLLSQLQHQRRHPSRLNSNKDPGNFFDAQYQYLLRLALDDISFSTGPCMNILRLLLIYIPHLILLRSILCPLAHLLALSGYGTKAPLKGHQLLLVWGYGRRLGHALSALSCTATVLTAACLLLYVVALTPSPRSTILCYTLSVSLASATSLVTPSLDIGLRAAAYSSTSPPDKHAPYPGMAMLGGKSKPPNSISLNGDESQANLKLVVDSGASFHVHAKREHLSNLRPCSDRIIGIDRKPHACPEIGDLALAAKTSDGRLRIAIIRNVRLCPSCDDTLISVGQLWREAKAEVVFRDQGFIQTTSGIQFPLTRQRGLYLLKSWPVDASKLRRRPSSPPSLRSTPSTTPPASDHVCPKDHMSGPCPALFAHTVHSNKAAGHIAALSPDVAAAHLHRRLHLGARKLAMLPKLTEDAPDNISKARLNACPDCVTANATHTAHTSKRYVESSPGRLVHADIAGPFVDSVKGHYKYLLVMVDDHTRFKFAFPLVDRAQAPSKIRAFIASFNKLAHRSSGVISPIGSLHTDGAGEFTSRKFRNILGDLSVDKTESPPEIHALNGVAERAIRTIFAHVRSDLEASGAPKSFWPFAVSHAVDIINRTTCPPHNRCTSYEALTGSKPRVMSIWPFGCQAFSVVPKAFRKKMTLDNTAVKGVHIGKSDSQPGAYNVWVPRDRKVVSSSDTYFDETFMPWRVPGDQRRSDPIPSPGDADAEQPPTIPILAEGDLPDSPPALNSIAAEFERTARSPLSIAPRTKSARLSKTVLILFSGPYTRPDGLIAYLQRLGLNVKAVDNDASNGGDRRDDLSIDPVYETLLRRAHRGDFLGIFAAPPCSTFSYGRFVRSSSSKDGGPPVIRKRSAGQVTGTIDCPAAHRRELDAANLLVARTCAILRAGVEAGSEFIMENPADRGDPSRPDLFRHQEHAPIWVMPEVLELAKFAAGRQVTFPMCAFGANYVKPTTFLYSPGMEAGLSGFDLLRCRKDAKGMEPSGGVKANGVWNSAAKAAYPAELNLALAKAFHLLVNAEPLPLDRFLSRPEQRAGQHFEAAPRPLRETTADLPPQVVPTAPAPRAEPSSSTTLQRGSPLDADDAPPASSTPMPLSTLYPGRPADYVPEAEKPAEARPDLPSSRTRHATRLRQAGNTSHSYLACVSDDPSLPALMLLSKESDGLPNTSADSSASRPDPKNRTEAMRDDPDGWAAAERAELDNHSANGSFELLDRATFDGDVKGRKLIKLVWVYKRKRSGKMKARLCVQGCCQQAGVDYDQTHCATMRGTSLRMLSAIAGQHDLKMRRWDFVSAYLQGALEPGEVVYCHSPPGPYGESGKDKRQRVWKVVKPVYGMAQAGRRWQRTLFPWLTKWGLNQCESDPCVFRLQREVDTPGGKRLDTLILGCYVDDLFILYNSDDEHSLYKRFTNDLSSTWSVDDEGEVSDLLNIEIIRGEKHVLLRQSAYIQKMMDKWLPDGPPAHVQINSAPHTDDLPSRVLDATLCNDPRDPILVQKYQSLVGALLCNAAMNTRPDIAYSVGMLCRAMSKPSDALFESALRVLSYLHRHKHVGLRYEASNSPLSGMADSDWVVRHSTSGYVFTLSRAAISWGSKRQQTIALSSCEAEIMAASEASKEAVYLDRLYQELGFKTDAEPLRLSLDNKAAIDSAYNPENHARTKHIDRRHYFIRELVEANKIVVPFVRSADNLADFFTKPLRAVTFFSLRNKIMNISQSDPG